MGSPNPSGLTSVAFVPQQVPQASFSRVGCQKMVLDAPQPHPKHLSLAEGEGCRHAQKGKEVTMKPVLARMEPITQRQALWQRQKDSATPTTGHIKQIWAAMTASSYYPDLLNGDAGDGWATWVC